MVFAQQVISFGYIPGRRTRRQDNDNQEVNPRIAAIGDMSEEIQQVFFRWQVIPYIPDNSLLPDKDNFITQKVCNKI